MSDRNPVLCVAVRLQSPDPRPVEEALARLCADGLVEVLDGVVVRWPGARLRPLRNLPRTAVLPESVWAVLCAQLLPGPHPGDSAVLAFCVEADPATLVRELERVGAEAALTPMDGDRYAALRVPAVPAASVPAASVPAVSSTA